MDKNSKNLTWVCVVVIRYQQHCVSLTLRTRTKSTGRSVQGQQPGQRHGPKVTSSTSLIFDEARVTAAGDVGPLGSDGLDRDRGNKT